VCWAALCFAGWIFCCPCWTLGFSLRDPSDYYKYNYDNYDYDNNQHQHHHHSERQQQQQLDDDELTRDLCWPCDCVT